MARRLDHFEKRLGAVMFNRTPEGLKLSADGQLVLVQAEQVEGQIDDIERILVGRDQRLQGHVRVTFPEPVGTGFLMRDLGRFVDAYPDISLDFIGSYEALSLTRGEADIAVRVTDSPPDHLVGRRLGHYAVAVYASTRLPVDTRSAFEIPNRATGSIGESADRSAKRRGCARFPTFRVARAVASAPLQLAAVEAGVGLAALAVRARAIRIRR